MPWCRHGCRPAVCPATIGDYVCLHTYTWRGCRRSRRRLSTVKRRMVLTWSTSAPDLLVAREGLAVGVLGDALYGACSPPCACEPTPPPPSPASQLPLKPPPSAAHSTRPHPPAYRPRPAAAVGGYQDGSTPNYGDYTSTVEAYDGSSWSKATSMHLARADPAIGVLNGTLYGARSSRPACASLRRRLSAPSQRAILSSDI